jgi:hypothetical protein
LLPDGCRQLNVIVHWLPDGYRHPIDNVNRFQKTFFSSESIEYFPLRLANQRLSKISFITF